MHFACNQTLGARTQLGCYGDGVGKLAIRLVYDYGSAAQNMGFAALDGSDRAKADFFVNARDADGNRLLGVCFVAENGLYQNGVYRERNWKTPNGSPPPDFLRNVHIAQEDILWEDDGETFCHP